MLQTKTLPLGCPRPRERQPEWGAQTLKLATPLSVMQHDGRTLETRRVASMTEPTGSGRNDASYVRRRYG